MKRPRFGWRDALQVLGIVGGWGLLTLGIARLTVPEVWPISAGLLLLSLCGWGFLRVLFLEGLYVLSRGRRE